MPTDAANPPFVVTFRPAEDDYVALMDRYWKLTPKRVLGVRTLQALVIAASAVAAYLAWKTRDVVFTFAAAALLSWPLTVPYFNRRGYGRIFRRQRLGEADATVTIDEKGVSAVSSISSQSFPWTAISMIDVAPDHAFVWINPYFAVMLPAAAFSDRATFERAVDFSKARVQGDPF
ncbi:MAG: hypothetical protein ABL897_12965 [Hyphomicrobium sp.]